MSGRQYPDQSDTQPTTPDTDDSAIPTAAVANKATPDDAWERVTSRMRQDIGEAAWRNWIKPLRVSRLEDGTLTL